MAVARQDFDDLDDPEEFEQPWHNRTPAVVGASIVGLVLIGILVLTISYVARKFSEPEQAPLHYVVPSYSATATRSATSPALTTTPTVASTSRPQTTDLEPGSTTATTTSETTSETTASEDIGGETETGTTYRRGGSDGDDSESTERTTRRTPRTNVTRTFNPVP